MGVADFARSHRCADTYKTPLLPGMEYSLARPIHLVSTQSQANKHKMSILAMAHPTLHAPFKRDYAWEDSRQSEYASRPRSEDRIALPSIRQVRTYKGGLKDQKTDERVRPSQSSRSGSARLRRAPGLHRPPRLLSGAWAVAPCLL